MAGKAKAGSAPRSAPEKPFEGSVVYFRQSQTGSSTPEAGGQRVRLGAEHFEELVHLFHGRIYNFLVHMLNDVEDAAELTQETFLRAFASLKKFRGQSSVETWLFRIARNISLNHLKRKQLEQRHRLYPGGEEDADGPGTREWEDESPDPGGILVRKELRQLVRHCLKQLPVEAREVITLRDLEGCSYKEIAEVLQVSVEAVKSKIFRARVALREKLIPYVSAAEEKEL